MTLRTLALACSLKQSPASSSSEPLGRWPAIRAKLLDAHVLAAATPFWLGQPSSVCKMVLERLDADLSKPMTKAEC